MKVSIKFHHGCGDCSNFAHLLSLFKKRGYEVEVECSPDKMPLFLAAGAKHTSSGEHDHPWLHPTIQSFTRLDDNWNGNKTAHNINNFPMPNIGNDYERWEELCKEKLTLEDQITKEIRDQISDLTKDLPRPIILIHTKGNTNPGNKNLQDNITLRLYDLLLNKTDGTLVLLDWDNRVPWQHSGRIKRLMVEFPHLSLLQLYELMQNSDLLIGIDSGPLHFARFTKIPTLGIWTNHYPSHFVLPSDNAVHLVSHIHEPGDKYRRMFFNTVIANNDISVEHIITHALRILEKPKYILDPAFKMRDVQLQNFIDRNRCKFVYGLFDPHFKSNIFWDRNISFDKALRRLSTKKNPKILETGCIRQEDDWSAGFSTFLFGHFVYYNKGKLHSVDTDTNNCKFARKWTEYFGNAVTIHNKHSHEFLREFNEPVDLFYSDSADVGTDGYQECCLEEVKLAQKLLGPESIILIDDTPEEKGFLTGKGTLATPWLLANGWKFIYSGYQKLFERQH